MISTYDLVPLGEVMSVAKVHSGDLINALVKEIVFQIVRQQAMVMAKGTLEEMFPGKNIKL